VIHKTSKLTTTAAALAGLFSLGSIACGDDASPGATTTSTSDGTDSMTSTGNGSDGTAGATTKNTGATSDTGGTDTWGMEPAGDTAAIDAPCLDHVECMSRYCEIFRDLPADPNRSCQTGPEAGSMRITGTVRDLRTMKTISGASVKVAGAVPAISNPTATPGIVTAKSDAMGRFDVSSDQVQTQTIGIVALTNVDNYCLSSTGLASPDETTAEYALGNTIHDIWVVSSDDLMDWSDVLMGDTEVAPYLPLGEKGGIIGLIRDAEGMALAGATIASEEMTSKAIIRYLADDGMSFTETATGSSGIFVIVNPGLAEGFIAEAGGKLLGSNIGGSTEKTAFIMVLP